MKEILVEAFQKKQYIAVYSNPSDTSKFAYGKLLGVDDIVFALYLISPNGEYDGILVQEIREIQYLEVGGQYEQKIKKLCALHDLPDAHIPVVTNHIKTDILLDAKASGKAVALEVNYSGIDDITGCVENVKNNICTIKKIDPFGCGDGIAFIDISHITQISYDSQNEQKVLYLYLLNQNQ